VIVEYGNKDWANVHAYTPITITSFHIIQLANIYQSHCIVRQRKWNRVKELNRNKEKRW